MQKQIRLMMILVLCAFVTNLNARQFGFFEARSAAMGNTSAAIADIATAPFANPAMLAFQRADEDYALLVPAVGVFVDDSEGVIDLVDQFQAASLIPGPPGLAAQTQALLALEGKVITPSAAAAVALGFSGETYSFSVSSRIDAVAGVGAFCTAPCVKTSPTTITNPQNSQLVILGVTTIETGLSIARNFDILGGKLAVGVTPKFVSAEAFASATVLATADTGDLFDNQVSVDLNDFFTVDAGIVYSLTDSVNIALVAKNLIEEDISFDPGFGAGTPVAIATLNTQVRAGIGYRSDFLTFGADVDLTESNPIATEPPAKMVSAGVEFNLLDFMQLRAGVQKNVASGLTTKQESPLYTAGVGLWLGFHVDIAAQVTDDSVGGFVQTGFRF